MNSGIHQRYKRSQVEQAIVAIDAGRGTAEAVLRANVKRLLDFDRNPEARILHRASDTTAFFDGPSPGQGAEIAYRPYQAFALLIGVRLLKSGMPQSQVVLFMRDTRVDLESAFAHLASVDAAELYRNLSEEERSERIREGDLVREAAKMMFLIVQAGAEPTGRPRPEDWELEGGNVCNVEALIGRLEKFSEHGQAAIILELTNAVHQLMNVLPLTTVRKRGRQ